MNKHILFYDGHCGLCHRWVMFVLRFDRNKNFLFSPLQGEKIKEVLSLEIRSSLPDSIVVLANDGDIYLKAKAVEFILCEMGGVFKAMGRGLALVPQAFSNLCYDFIAKIRTRIFGTKEDLCPLMSVELRELFLP